MPRARLTPLSLVVVVAIALLPRAAWAAMMYHHDLTSLALEAEEIVRARQVSERKENDWTTVRTMRVTRVYKGHLATGGDFEISYDGYSLVPFSFWGAPDAGPPPGDEMVLFLKRRQSEGDAGPGLWLVPSGLRILLGSKVQRFEQWNNPGGYVPVPQGHDPFDLYGDARGGQGLDLAGFEVELEKAQARADQVSTALAAPDGPSARRHLIELCGPPSRDDEPRGIALGGFFSNLAAGKMVSELAKRGDLRATLEAYARSSGVASFRLDVPIPVAQILDAAADTKLALPLRLAALNFAEGKWYELRETPVADARLVSLLGDHAWQIRLAAVSVRATERPSTARRSALVARWKSETDDRVRIALVRSAESDHVVSELRAVHAPMPVVTASLARDVVTIAWADLDDRVNLMVRSAQLVAKAADGDERTVDLFASRRSYSNGAMGSMTTQLSFDRPFLSGDVRCELSVVIEELNKARPDLSRHFALGTMRAAVVAQALHEPDAGAEAQRSEIVAPAPSAPIPVPRARRSACGCEAAPVGGAGASWLFAGAAVVLTLRRAGPRPEKVGPYPISRTRHVSA